MRALSIAATGMLAQQLNVEVISNNIANPNTTGHKRQRAEFQETPQLNLNTNGTQMLPRSSSQLLMRALTEAILPNSLMIHKASMRPTMPASRLE